jgi:predicted MFS family arabinose efflux permease
MAMSCALAVAAIYYHQPLLPQIVSTFGVSPTRGSLIATLTQLGYAMGLFFVVPLADSVQSRKLASLSIVGNAMALLACAAAPTFFLLAASSFAVGVTAVSAQIIIPTVAGRATPAARGRVVGSLLGGLSSGVLLARLFGGVIGAHLGWRAIFVVASIVDLALVAVLSQLPVSTGLTTVRYRDLMRSLNILLREERLLRISAASGFLVFAAFNAFWATLAALLARPPYGFGPAAIGAFGLIGLPGLVMSSRIGAVIDRLGTRKMVTAGAVTVGMAFVFVAAGGSCLATLIFGMVLLDVGNRVCLVANQSRIYALRPDARSRLNTVFFVSSFLGAAMGAALGGYGANRGTWLGLATVGWTLSLAAVAVNMLAYRESIAVPDPVQREGRYP